MRASLHLPRPHTPPARAHPQADLCCATFCRAQAVEAQGVESMLVLLRAAVQPPTRLDGLKSRALRAEAPTPRHLYVTMWCALEAGAAAHPPVLLLSCGKAMPGSDGKQGTFSALHDDMPLSKPAAAAVCVRDGQAGLEPLCAVEVALALVQSRAAAAAAPAVWLLTEGAQLAQGLARPSHAGAWGLARSARAEAPLPLRCIDGSLAMACELDAAQRAEPQVVVCGGICYTPRLKVAAFPPPPAHACAGSHILTGGTGGLGLLTGRWLAQRGVECLALASRSGVLARGAAAEWQAVQA